MAGQRHVLALDQGTTSSRSIVFDERGPWWLLPRRSPHQQYPRSGGSSTTLLTSVEPVWSRSRGT